MSIRQRAVVGTVATLGVVGTSLGLFATQGPEHPATEVQVEDTAQVLHEPGLREGVDGVRFHEPTTVAVFTHRGGEEALTDDLALNDAVLEHARENRPDWLSADEQHWADDLFILGVDPEGRLVGTYFGENRTVGEDTQLEIQDATKDDFRAGRWTDGAVAGIEAASSRMNAPFLRSPGGIATAGAASLLTLGGAGAYLGVGLHRARRSRRARAAGDAAMASVVRDYETTELHARLIPSGSRYGGLMLRRYDDYTRGFRELTDLGNEVRGIPERDHDTAEAVERLTAYETKATSLDQLDDVIADTAALLNKDRAWAEAWNRQVNPVREDLLRVEPLLTDDLPEELRGLPETQQLREFASQALVDLDLLRDGLESGEVTPDDALDHLRETRDRLSGRLDALVGVVARESAENDSERETMTTAMGKERDRRVREATIVSAAYPAWTWYPVSAFQAGYSAGHSEVQQARSGGGSSSGYSGGSFSGAGSSSRF